MVVASDDLFAYDVMGLVGVLNLITGAARQGRHPYLGLLGLLVCAHTMRCVCERERPVS